MSPAPFAIKLIALFADWVLSYFAASFFASIHWGLVRDLQPIVFYLELIIFTSITGASIGQNLMRIKVVRFQDGGRLEPQWVILRTTLLMLFLPAILTRNGRHLHDIAGRSLVIRSTSV